MTQTDRISPRQFMAACFVSALALLIRRFPRALAARAGRGALLAVPLSALPMLLALAATALLLRRRASGGGISGAFADLLGARAGRLLQGFYGLWFLCYAGYLLRSGAERLITTVYTGAQPWLFVGVMALACALASAGRLLPVMRSAMLFRPLLLALILLIALLTAQDLDCSLLLPLRAPDLPAAGVSALEITNLLSIGLFFSFFGSRLTRPLRAGDVLPWLAVLLAVIGLMTVGCLGMFGPALTAELRYPYFMLVRDLTVLGALERLEPLVITLWIFPDFVLISLLLQLAADCLCGGAGPDHPFRRWAAPLGAAAAAAAALALPGSLDAQRALSERIVPILCAVFGFGPLPALLLIGALRRKL